MIHYGKPYFVHLIIGIREPKNGIPGDGLTRVEEAETEKARAV